MAVGLTSPEIMERIVHQVIREGRYRAQDDISRELAPGVTPMLAALDGGVPRGLPGRLLQVISPSVRVGYVVAHRDLVRDIARTKMAVGLTSPRSGGACASGDPRGPLPRPSRARGSGWNRRMPPWRG